MSCDSAQDAAGTAADMADSGVGHGVADVMRDRAIGQPHRIGGVVTDQPAARIEGQADSLIAKWISLVFPAKVLQAARRMRERAIEEVEDLRLVAGAKRANGVALVHGNVS